VRLCFTYSEPLAHLIYAAADLFLVPSMFEPCGLTQMIALRYGALPVVRATGGLRDTVVDVGDGVADVSAADVAARGADAAAPPRPNGFVFEGVDAGSLFGALDRALALRRERPGAWAALSAAAMADADRWSWEAPAAAYEALYRGAGRG
jgi:starch synthase